MLRELKSGERVKQVRYALEFTDEYGNGFSFPCDEHGNLERVRAEALPNVEYCRTHRDQFVRFGVITKYTDSWREPDMATCECGHTFPLQNVYLGACPCPNCGKWYNLFGQELLPPYKWGDIDGDDI